MEFMYSIYILSITHLICKPYAKTFMLIGVLSASASIIGMTISIMYSLLEHKVLL
jgi:hypothetical protein